MGRFGDDKLEEVRARADIVEVIGAHVRLKRVGRNFVGLCPFHNEKTPSFSVNRERGFFHCFGCGAGGTVFNFLMRMDGLTFPEAVRALAERYGIELPERTEGGMERGERESLQRANQVAAEFFSHVLWNTEDGVGPREYLKSRGITTETAYAFMLGYAPPRPASLARALEPRGLRDAGIRLGLIRSDADGVRDLFRARVMFPIRDAQGRVSAFGARVLDDRLPKYLNSPESPLYSKTRTLYGLYEARQEIARHDRAILVEGYFDAIALWQAGFKETVAGCGTALTVEQLRVLARYTKNVIACFDGDDAGRRASLRALEIFLEAGLLGRGIFIPTGYDPDTLVRERGADAFRETADNARLLVQFFFDEEKKKYGGPKGSLEQRLQAAQNVAQKLRLIGNEVEFNLLVREAVSSLGFGDREEAMLRGEGRRRGGVAPRRVARQLGEASRATVETDAVMRAQISLIAIAARYPSLRAEIFALQPFRLFSDLKLAELLKDACESHEDVASLAPPIAEQMNEVQRSAFSLLLVGGPDESETEVARNEATGFINPDFRDVDETHLKPGIEKQAGEGITAARRQISDHIRLLQRAPQRDRIEALKRDVATGEEAQEVIIALRRGANTSREPN